eukprot:gene23415-biopygen11834
MPMLTPLGFRFDHVGITRHPTPAGLSTPCTLRRVGVHRLLHERLAAGHVRSNPDVDFAFPRYTLVNTVHGIVCTWPGARSAPGPGPGLHLVRGPVYTWSGARSAPGPGDPLGCFPNERRWEGIRLRSPGDGPRT